ncbi:MAG: AMP-binding protein, partial [Bacteroidales bacterium]
MSILFKTVPVKLAISELLGISNNSALCYAELKEKADAFAAALGELGVKKGDRVALYLLNSPQFV